MEYWSVAEMRIHVLFESQPERGFTVTVPDLPGCVSQGETEQECLDNIGEAIDGWIETAAAHWWPIPEPRFTTRIVDICAS